MMMVARSFVAAAVVVKFAYTDPNDVIMTPSVARLNYQSSKTERGGGSEEVVSASVLALFRYSRCFLHYRDGGSDDRHTSTFFFSSVVVMAPPPYEQHDKREHGRKIRGPFCTIIVRLPYISSTFSSPPQKVYRIGCLHYHSAEG